MKRRVAKKIVRKFNKAALQGKAYGRRGLVNQAHKILNLELPSPDVWIVQPTSSTQEPKAVAVQPKVSNTGTSDGKALPNSGTSAAKVLTRGDTPVDSMTVVELKALCKERGTKGYSKLNREGLIDTLKEA